MNPTSMTRFIEQLHSAFHEGDDQAATKHLEAANVRCLQEQYRAILRGDFAFVSNSMAEDIDMEMLGPPGLPMVGHWRGRQQVGDAVRNNFAMLEDQHADVLGVVAQGDTVVLFAREKGRLRASDRSYEFHWVQLFTFKDGKIVRFRGLYDTAAMLEALGETASVV